MAKVANWQPSDLKKKNLEKKNVKIYQSLVKLPYKQMQTNHLVTPKYA